MRPAKSLTQRIDKLKSHLQQENPMLVEVVDYYRQLDKIGYQTGILTPEESFANRISWWPLVSVLGTFSAGKSSFINSWLGMKLQQTGNQAVDDKFTVISYSRDEEVRTLPGLALDADPRFPFYQISEEIERVSQGEGGRIDSYLQLKTCHCEQLKGKILIDSPGFDADAQRSAILKISDHIIDLSDLVIVFFDARHPEPGAMQDTLEHLVRSTVERNDANKFMFVLNQIDVTAHDDNLEEVVAAWQKAIAQTGLTAGAFFCIYNEDVAVDIPSETVRERYQARRDRDLRAIVERVDQVGVERIYRIIGSLENTANQIEQKWMPKIAQLFKRYRKRVLISDAALLAVAAAAALGVGALVGGVTELAAMLTGSWIGLGALALIHVGVLWLHFRMRKWHADVMLKRLKRAGENTAVLNGFRKNTHFAHSVIPGSLIGWRRSARKRLAKIREVADGFVQTLNDRFTNPSGESEAS
ncbi:MAG TPA: dynamin family protein [Gammaproteobacteria bacterium]|nr:dynamin family protein [Gammaproteobacteria bacterium]